MKRKILAVGLFSLCALASLVGESNAWHFPLLHHNRYVTHITCRPYNAFTPICWGNLVCDGCCPSPCGVAGGQLPMTMGAPPWANQGFGCGPMACGPQGCMASDMPLMQNPPMPDIRNQPFQAPMPMPVQQGPNMTMYPQQGVAQANFYPMYQPQYIPNYYMPTYYNPNMGWPNSQPAPYYWYGNGR